MLNVLLKARIPVYNAHKIGRIHTHAKDLYISALVGGKQQNLVVSGSLNMTRGSLNANDEAGYKINSAAAFAEYNALWNIWAANSTAHQRRLGDHCSGDHSSHHQRPDPDRGLNHPERKLNLFSGPEPSIR